ncbi:hypothetical protein JCM19045_2621 [Bacillus sp. JCM 19045]|nr:hypothetical protein JCM19045_2621 [Bacillus sp. JCM 19045]
MMKNSIDFEINKRLERLSQEKQRLVQEAINYIRSSSISKRQADQVIMNVLDEWMYAEKNQLDLPVTKKTLHEYCDKRLAALPEASLKLRVARTLGNGLFILGIVFAIQMIVQFIAFFDSTVQATAFSFLPLIFLGSFSLLGMYLAYSTRERKRPFLRKALSVTSYVAAIILFFASMRLWDSVLTIRLTFPLSVLLFISTAFVYLLVIRWKFELEQQQMDRNRDDVILFSLHNQSR